MDRASKILVPLGIINSLDSENCDNSSLSCPCVCVSAVFDDAYVLT